MPETKPYQKALESLICEAIGKPDAEKLEIVNQFYNTRIRYDADLNVWGVKEYWAAPDELMQRGAGDCEDFAIAKYLTLRDSGIDDTRLQIVYGRLATSKENHMILAYFGAAILILDNIMDAIFSLQERSDLIPVMGFNHSGLWIFRRGEPELLTRNSNRLARWRELRERMLNATFGN
jgi:predicted transglutaminase-like cysteine proteinase